MKEIKLSEKNKDFFQLVFEVARLIPYGRVTSYGAIAKYLGSARSARMVGWAMASSHKTNDVPAHRVINRNGLLTGKVHFAPPNTMEFLLQQEGIEVKDDKVVKFKELFWDPNIELKID